jgi:hypothetical protein
MEASVKEPDINKPTEKVESPILLDQTASIDTEKRKLESIAKAILLQVS